MRRTLKFLLKKWPLLLIVAVTIVCQCYLQLMLPEYMAKITLLIQSDSQNKINEIWINGGWMVLISIGVVILATTQNFLGASLSAYVGRVLRDEIFNKVNSMSVSNYTKFGTATLITRTTNDVEQIKNYLVQAIRVIFMSPTYMLIGLIKTLTRDATLSIVIAFCIPLILGVMCVLLALASPLFRALQVKIDRLTVVIRENLTGVRVVRAYNQQKEEYKKFDDSNKDMTKVITKVGKTMSIANPAVSIIFNLCYVGIFGLGFYLMNNQPIFTDKLSTVFNPKITTLMANIGEVAQYSLQIMQSFMMLAMILIMFPQASACSRRINEILDTKNTINDDETNVEAINKLENSSTKGVLTFKNVSFAYPDSEKECISNVSFETKPGKTTAIIGSTGSGKSTIINLIPRLFDATSGEILLDGVNIKNIPIKTLRDKIGFVPQKANLFKGTIKDNMLFGNKNATDDEINKALNIAQAEHFISKLPDGLNSYVSQGGKNFSGGQKQRLCIARALVKKAEIYVFDDSFSALDFKTDAKLRSELQKNIKDAAIVVVAQRVSSILNADTIIVLNDGDVVGKGTHDELLKTCSVYQDIVKSQLDPDEVEKTLNMYKEITAEGGAN